MTARDGYFLGGVVVAPQLGGNEGTVSADNGYLAVFGIVTTTAPPTYKNQGWYAAGAVWESWVTTGAPSTAPPSGHTLTNLSYVVLPP